MMAVVSLEGRREPVTEIRWHLRYGMIRLLVAAWLAARHVTPGPGAAGSAAPPPRPSVVGAGRRAHGNSPLLLGVPRSHGASWSEDRKSTRLNSSHVAISYAVFCLKKKT